jgi:hypothetical protein
MSKAAAILVICLIAQAPSVGSAPGFLRIAYVQNRFNA